MNQKEIMQLLVINGKESPVFMPNEIFEDLQSNMVDSSHVAYAYSYMYLTHFLYRNCKYFNVKALLDGNTIKQILGYSKNNRTMNYITKKDGLLDEISYTKATKNYPISWEFKAESDEDVEFIMYDDLEDMADVLPSIPKTFFLKYPMKALEDRIIKQTTYTNDGEKEVVEYDVRGTYFDVEQTHSVDFNIFMFCMSKKELGVIAFYLYSWLKHKNDIFDGYDVPLTKLSEETGINRRSIIKYMDLLKGYRMISFQHNQDYFVLGAEKEDRKATTYITNNVEFFLDSPQEYKKMGVQLREEYLEMKVEQEKERKGITDKVDIPLSELPF